MGHGLMGHLRKNEEYFWKILTHYPEGITVKELLELTELRSSSVYTALGGLRSRGYVVREKCRWAVTAAPSLCPLHPEYMAYCKHKARF